MAAESASSVSRPPIRMNQGLFKRLVQEASAPTANHIKATEKALDAFEMARTQKEIKEAHDLVYNLTVKHNTPAPPSILRKLDKFGNSRLVRGLTFQNLPYIAFLIKYGANVNEESFVTQRDEDGNPRKDDNGNIIFTQEFTTPLQIAATISRFDYQPPQALLNQFKRAQLSVEMYMENNKPLALLLNSKKIEVNKKNHLGKTALHYAAALNPIYPYRVKLLLEHGADPTIEDNAGRRAIDDATHPMIRRMLEGASASSSASASRGGKRKTHRRTHHKRRTHRKRA